MEISKTQLDIIRALNDNRSKLSALYSLYNSSLLVAENSRQELGTYYEQMIDFKNDLNTLSSQIGNAKKSERTDLLTKNKIRIKKIGLGSKETSSMFNDNCGKYRIALKECGSLKTEYKHTISELCKQFKATINDDTDALILKGYKQQVKIIKAILDKIETLISDYNVKKNKMEEDNTKFNQLYESVNTLIDRLQTIA